MSLLTFKKEIIKKHEHTTNKDKDRRINNETNDKINTLEKYSYEDTEFGILLKLKCQMLMV